MTDHAKAREILDRNRELAKRYGYTPQDQRPEVIVAMNTPQGRLDELVAAGYRPVTDERWSRALGELPGEPRIVTDPATGRKEFLGSFQPQAAAGISLTAGIRTPVIDEVPPNSVVKSNVAIKINRFGLSPLGDYYRQLLPGAAFAYAEPQMFSSGPLPPFTASGLPVEVLQMTAWYLRHSAAYSESKSYVLAIVEESMDPDGPLDVPGIQTTQGADALQGYLTRIGNWVATPPAEDVGGNEAIQEQVDRLWGPQSATVELPE